MTRWAGMRGHYTRPLVTDRDRARPTPPARAPRRYPSTPLYRRRRRRAADAPTTAAEPAADAPGRAAPAARAAQRPRRDPRLGARRQVGRASRSRPGSCSRSSSSWSAPRSSREVSDAARGRAASAAATRSRRQHDPRARLRRGGRRTSASRAPDERPRAAPTRSCCCASAAAACARLSIPRDTVVEHPRPRARQDQRRLRDRRARRWRSTTVEQFLGIEVTTTWSRSTSRTSRS